MTPNERQSDYKPLTLRQIKLLLAKNRPIGTQVRLTQAIPGITSPQQIDGPIARSAAFLSSLYCAGIRENWPRDKFAIVLLAAIRGRP